MRNPANGQIETTLSSAFRVTVFSIRAFLLLSVLFIVVGCSLLSRGDLHNVDFNGNTSPTADAGFDFGVTTGNTASLDGSASFDIDGDPLSYTWYLITFPVGSILSDASITDRFTASPTLTPDMDGTFTLELQVDDGELTSTDTIKITASTVNTPPMADAGANLNVFENTTITLDGSGSSDADLDLLTYIWTFVSRPVGSVLTDVDITGSTTSTPSFIPDFTGNFLLELTVNDGTDSNSDTVVVTSYAAPLSELVGEWLFSGGGLDDTSSFGSIGTPNGATPTPDRNGNTDAAYYFNGTASIDFGDDVHLNYTDMMSFSCWFRADDIDIDYGRIVSKRSSPVVAGWELNVGTGDTMGLNRGDTQNAVHNSSGIIQGTWHHIAFTWHPSAAADQIKFYLDGTLLAGTSLSGGAALEPEVSAEPLTLGMAAYGNAAQFMGALDDVRYYHGILTDSDVMLLASESAMP